MINEISFLIFQVTLGITFVSSAAYLVFFVTQNNKIRTVARSILIVSWGLQTLYIISRFYLAGHTPITTHHEAVFFFAWSTTAAYLSFRWRHSVKNFGTFVSILISSLLLVAAFAPRDLIPLEPALQSIWLPIHAGLSLIAYGFLALAFCGGFMYLLQEHELKSRRLGYFFTRLPSLEALDQLNAHCLAVGFAFLTLGMVTGIFWSKQAWATYWRWNPKEVCTLIIWFTYLIQIHQRFTVGWRGRRAAVMVVIGFLIVLITLWLVIT